MNEERPIAAERYQAPKPRELLQTLWPTALPLAIMYAGKYFIGGWMQQLAWAVLSVAMIVWSVWGIVQPRAEDWLDPVLDAPIIALNRRNTRRWSIVSLLLWILVASYTIFDLIHAE